MYILYRDTVGFIVLDRSQALYFLHLNMIDDIYHHPIDYKK